MKKETNIEVLFITNTYRKFTEKSKRRMNNPFPIFFRLEAKFSTSHCLNVAEFCNEISEGE